MLAKTAAALDRSWSRWPGSFDRFIARVDSQKLPYLSHSKVSLYERCPRCYYRRYVLGERKESAALLMGTLFHLAAKNLYVGIGGGSLPNSAELLDRKKINTLPEESRNKLRNALTLLRNHYWEDHKVLSLEDPFFMDLAAGLPPVIGIPDLVLQRNSSLLVVDHKTSKSFNNLDCDQLVLYAEHLRRLHGTRSIIGVFDEYRLVPDLSTIRKPAFRRTPVSVDRSLLPALVRRYRRVWKEILAIDRDDEPLPASDCWICNSQNSWY